MSVWKDCVKEPPKIGKQVLCRKGDCYYVATRIDDIYVSLLFLEHPISKDVVNPDCWMEIDSQEQDKNEIELFEQAETGKAITLDECRMSYEVLYKVFCKSIRKNLGSLVDLDEN